MTTYFDEWIQSLTVSDFVKIVSGRSCDKCPVRDVCGPDEYGDEFCEDVLRRYADKEVLEHD